MSTVAAQQQPIISPKDSIPSVIERVTGKENKGFSAHMNLQLYTSCAASFTENELDEVAFKLNRFKPGNHRKYQPEVLLPFPAIF